MLDLVLACGDPHIEAGAPEASTVSPGGTWGNSRGTRSRGFGPASEVAVEAGGTEPWKEHDSETRWKTLSDFAPLSGPWKDCRCLSDSDRAGSVMCPCAFVGVLGSPRSPEVAAPSVVVHAITKLLAQFLPLRQGTVRCARGLPAQRSWGSSWHPRRTGCSLVPLRNSVGWDPWARPFFRPLPESSGRAWQPQLAAPRA